MATIEKLFVQIFERKRSIIEHLKQQKQQYDQHLLSKLLIQGIPPPQWLLNPELSSSTSDLTEINKEELISGLLLPRPGPLASYASGPCFYYDKPVAKPSNIEHPQEICAKTCSSSNGYDENEPNVAPPCHVDGAEDGAAGYVPMSPEDQTDAMVSSTCAKAEQSLARIQRSRSRQKALELRNSAKASGKSCLGKENDGGVVFENRICGNGQQLDGLRESVEFVKPLAFSVETCSKELALGDCSNKVWRSDACSESASQSAGNEVKKVQSEDNEKEEQMSNDPQIRRNSHEVYIGRMTRSRSGKAQQSEIDDPQIRRVTRSRSHASQIISGNHAIEESKACNGRIARSKSNGAREAEIKDHRSRTKNDMSVKPKQLDFDEVEESCLANILTEGQHISEERTSAHHVEEKADSVPCALFAERTSETHVKPLTCETMEVHESEVAHSLPKSERLSRRTSFLPCVSDMQATNLSLTDTDIDADTDAGVDATMNLDREAIEATVCSDKISQDSSSCKNRNVSLHNKTPELVQSNPGTKSDGASASVLNFPPDNTWDKTRPELASELLKLGSQLRSADVQTSCFSSHDRVVGGPKLSERQAAISTLPEYDFSDAKGSWPCYKRRKIEYQLQNKSAIPSFRVNSFRSVNGSIRNMFSDKDDSSPILHKLVTSHDSDAIISNSGFGSIEPHHSANFSLNQESVLNPEVQNGEGEFGLQRSFTMPFTSEDRQLLASSVSKLEIAEHTDNFSKGNVRTDPTSTIPDNERVSLDSRCGEAVADRNSSEELIITDMVVDPTQLQQQADQYDFSVGSPVIEHMSVCVSDVDEIEPEYAGFIIAEKRESIVNDGDEPIHGKMSFLSHTTEDTGLLGKVSRPASLSTPGSPFPTAYKLHLTPGVYRSVPNGLLENNDLRTDQMSSCSALEGKSYSDYFSFPSSRHAWDIGKPFISPLGKGFEGMTSKSGGSDKRVSGNTELNIFPIQEDPESSEEEVDGNDVVGTSLMTVDSNMRTSSLREPLHDITVKNEGTLGLSDAVERGSLETVGTEICESEMNNKESKDNEMHRRSRRIKQGKENQSLSIGVNSIKKHSEAYSSRYSKPKLSGKSSLRSRGQSLSEKESKRNNIVSNVKSFIPLVQQKQAAAVAPAKREVKVKALEAAEAAKRLAEKRENERKQKKDALKLERARQEQENLKQMELKKRLKEEEKKKRDADNAAKKRQREEEERKDKERKRKRIEEARCQQKQAEGKLHACREESRCGSEVGRELERKDSNYQTENLVDRAKDEEVLRKPSNELVGNDGRETDAALPNVIQNKASTCSSGTGKVGSMDAAEVSTPNCDKTCQSIAQTSQEQSYDISPYQCSDDEEEEEDDIPNKKFIPTWASKSCVALALSSLNQLDPNTIFPPGTFCSLEEVLLPRRLPQK